MSPASVRSIPRAPRRAQPDEPGPVPVSGDVWEGSLGVWHLNDDELSDASPNLRDGLVVASTSAPGAIAQGREYDGMSWDELPVAGNSGEGTVQLWFRGGMDQRGNPTGGTSLLFHVSSDRDADGYKNELSVSIQREEELSVRVESGPDTVDEVPVPHCQTVVDGLWQDDQWHHVVSTWSTSQGIARLWVDGDQMDEDDTPLADVYDFTAFLHLGGVDYMNRSFTGELDEVRFYDIVLTPEHAGLQYYVQRDDFTTVGSSQPLP